MPLPPIAPPATTGQLIESWFPASTGYTQTYGNPASEHGIDINQAGGSAVPLPFEGIFRADLSTAFQQVFQTASGVFESLTHVTPNTTLRGGQDYAAGTTAGYVYPLAGPYTGYAAGETVTYTSSGPHIELGLAQGNITGPADFFNNAFAFDPVPYLAGHTHTTTPPVNPTTPTVPTIPGLPDPTGLVSGATSGLQHIAIGAGFVVALLVIGALLVFSLMNKDGVKAVPV